jgi:hypothetical protein
MPLSTFLLEVARDLIGAGFLVAVVYLGCVALGATQ